MTTSARRRAMRLALLSGILWSMGNGLTSGTIIYYLAMDLGAAGVGMSLLLALPGLAGVLRLGTPLLIAHFGSAKRSCLAMLWTAYGLLCGLPLLIFGLPQLLGESDQGLITRPTVVVLLVLLICVHQLFEYLGVVALWSWLAEIVPRQVRGRYFGLRQMLQLLALIPVLWLSGAFVDHWKASHSNQADMILCYGITTGIGAALLLLSVVPLGMMPGSLQRCSSRPSTTEATEQSPATPSSRAPLAEVWQTLWRPFADRRFRPLLYYGAWLSTFNGLAQSAQYIYPKEVLKFDLLTLAQMLTLMRVGQMLLAPLSGYGSDRYGNRPVLIACLWCIGTAPLFFLLATPAHPYWLWGAWLLWSAWGGVNVCQPNLTLRLAERCSTAAYMGSLLAVSGFAYAASTVIGGVWFDHLKSIEWSLELGSWRLDRFGIFFLIAWPTRTAAVWLIARVPEPGASRWSGLWQPR